MKRFEIRYMDSKGNQKVREFKSQESARNFVSSLYEKGIEQVDVRDYGRVSL